MIDLKLLEEAQLLSSVQYAIEILPRCNVPDDQRFGIEIQLNRALNLLRLQHDLIQANDLYGNIDVKLLNWCTISSEQVQQPEVAPPETPPLEQLPSPDGAPTGEETPPEVVPPITPQKAPPAGPMENIIDFFQLQVELWYVNLLAAVVSGVLAWLWKSSREKQQTMKP